MTKDIFDIFSITSDRVTNLFRRIVRFDSRVPSSHHRSPFSLSRGRYTIRAVRRLPNRGNTFLWSKYRQPTFVLETFAIVSIRQSEIKQKCIEMQRRIKM